MEGPNPYAAPVSDFAADAPTNEHEATRRRLIGTETNVRSLGALVIFGSVISAASGLGALSSSPVDGVVTLVVAAVALYAGLALRKLDPVGRMLWTIVALIGVIRVAWTIATLSSQPGASSLAPALLVQIFVIALFLALLWGRNGKDVFTEHYRRVVVPATPHVKYKTSVVAIVVLVIVVLGLIAAIVGAVLAS